MVSLIAVGYKNKYLQCEPMTGYLQSSETLVATTSVNPISEYAANSCDDRRLPRH